MTALRPLLSQPQSNGELVFDAPWQARAFAMAVHLNEQGVFSWAAWSFRLANFIRVHEEHESIQNSDDYYRVWLDALESMITEADW